MQVTQTEVFQKLDASKYRKNFVGKTVRDFKRLIGLIYQDNQKLIKNKLVAFI